MLKAFSTSFLYIETAKLQIFSKVYQYAVLKISLDYTMQHTPIPDKPLPLTSFVLRRNFKVVQISDKLKPPRNNFFKTIKEPTQVTYEFLTQDGEIFHTFKNQLVP